MALILTLSFALNVLFLGAYVFSSYLASRERQQLALLIKSRDVQEFVRASAQLESPSDARAPEPSEPVDFDDLSPEEAARAISGGASGKTA